MPDRLNVDIAIVGAGPAGIAAACAAAESGKSVLLLDNMPGAGGNIWRGHRPPPAKAKHPEAIRWMARLARTKAHRLPEATVFAAPAANTILAETPAGVLEVHWQKLILATGARELFLPFPGWTLPNVFGCGGLQALAKGGWPIQGKRIVIAGTGPLLMAAAAQLKSEGAKVLLIAEQTDIPRLAEFVLSLPLLAPRKILQALAFKASLLGVPFKTSTWVTAAHGTTKIESVTLANESETWDVPCDLLACAFSLIPNLELPALLGCHISAHTVQVNTLMETSVPCIYCAGEPNGIGGVDTSLLEGQIAGHAAAASLDGPASPAAARATKLARQLPRATEFRQALKAAFMLRPELAKLAHPGTLVCRCEDVPYSALAAHASWRSAKLHTRCGMGSCQGRVCGGAVQTLFNWEGASVRPPVLPVSVKSLAGAPDLKA